MPPKQPTKRVDITRLNRAERRKMMRGGKMKVMIPGRNLPFVKKEHGEIKSFYAMRDKEIKEEEMAVVRQEGQVDAAPFSTTAMPDKPLTDKATL